MSSDFCKVVFYSPSANLLLKDMIVKGKIASSVHRGEGLIKKYQARLTGILGFRPLPGTLNVVLVRDVDIRKHSTKAVDFVLTDGRRKVEAYLAPVKIRPSGEQRMLRGTLIEGDETVTAYKWKKKDAFSLRKGGKFVTWDIIRSDADRQLIEYLKSRQEGKRAEMPTAAEYSCWAIRFTMGPQDKSCVEIIANTNLKETMGLNDDDILQVEFL